MQWYEWVGLISAVIGFPGNIWAIWQIYEKFSFRRFPGLSGDPNSLPYMAVAISKELSARLEGPEFERWKWSDPFFRNDPYKARREAMLAAIKWLLVSLGFFGMAILVIIAQIGSRRLTDLTSFDLSFLSLYLFSLSGMALSSLNFGLPKYRAMKLAGKYIKYLEQGGEPLYNRQK